MAWFRKKEPEVIRRGSSDVTEERKSVRVGGQKVEVRRVTEVGRPAEKTRDRSRSARGPNRGGQRGRARPDRQGPQTFAGWPRTALRRRDHHPDRCRSQADARQGPPSSDPGRGPRRPGPGRALRGRPGSGFGGGQHLSRQGPQCACPAWRRRSSTSEPARTESSTPPTSRSIRRGSATVSPGSKKRSAKARRSWSR